MIRNQMAQSHNGTKIMHRSLFTHAKMLVLGERHVRQALNLTDCLEVNRKAFMSMIDGTGVVPSRLGLSYPNKSSSNDNNAAQDWTLIKPAACYGDHVSMGLKVVSIRASNSSRGLPLVPATTLLLNASTGLAEAIVSATYLTVARTSAGPALAVQTFHPNLENLTIFGAGAQAECHIQLIELALGRPTPRITIINRSRERAEALKEKLSETTTSEISVVLLSDTMAVNQALQQADVISATTNTTTPLWEDEDGSLLKKGCLITGIGSYTTDMQEIPSSAVDRCRVLIDTPEAKQVGDLKHLNPNSHLITLMGKALADPRSVVIDDCIFYKAIGTAIQDVLTTELVVKQARALGIGQEMDMS